MSGVMVVDTGGYREISLTHGGWKPWMDLKACCAKCSLRWEVNVGRLSSLLAKDAEESLRWRRIDLAA